ncbi:SGNH/GDSL hydrolase family protein [Rathayibacter rathayi]|uniref:SGNH/GDSL hydrolase family protein n=1 Tax=Rathayibacter rathayi TaxID=33887 RepID=A0ABD6W8L5_RATRA|nr:GDSL-type esterase/lipase family protein [Rathayibacter rathayi]AZZ48269.1 SGNH/GDSL hydrolase family protein [Rathayibacter rathayi]MWV74160.1 hypothetical protein [Rathayibacter rathayi NCPPB 2980 = VKM Ac-1601]PPF14134.1 SGNH/GDSL hydrolase family protein [Rathayibacter rathayi]PPF24007.1 SGNH/GDSL hydrolase family protein [Rathayibacter rathayi]PPF48999.1 SGNH/GDSL hydrolase family protein [Rathayibacter rathayi]
MRLFPSLRQRTGVRRVRALAVGAVVALAAALIPVQAASACAPTSLSVLSLGDSITQGYATCGSLEDCPQNSWSTGTNPDVNSFATRLGAANPGTQITTANFANSGDVIAQVPSRVQEAVAAGVRADVVTLLVGGNDLCLPQNPVAADGYTMTPVDDFQAAAFAAITDIRMAWPTSHIVLSSMPDITKEWSVLKDGTGSLIWTVSNACRTTRGVDTEGKPLSRPAAAASAAAATKRIKQYNSALKTACTLDGPLCDWDGGALTATPVTEDLITTTDYFHPSVAGQAKIAAVQWAASDFAR